MLFMIIWWIFIGIIFFLFLIQLFSKDKEVKRKINSVITLFPVLQIIIVAVATKDPIFQEIGLPGFSIDYQVF